MILLGHRLYINSNEMNKQLNHRFILDEDVFIDIHSDGIPIGCKKVGDNLYIEAFCNNIYIQCSGTTGGYYFRHGDNFLWNVGRIGNDFVLIKRSDRITYPSNASLSLINGGKETKTIVLCITRAYSLCPFITDNNGHVFVGDDNIIYATGKLIISVNSADRVSCHVSDEHVYSIKKETIRKRLVVTIEPYIDFLDGTVIVFKIDGQCDTSFIIKKQKK